MNQTPDKLPAAVLFDLDGTLVDSLPDMTWAMNQLLAELGRKSTSLADMRTWVGDGAGVLVERCLAATGGVPGAPADAVGRFLAFYRTHAAVETRPFPGVLTTLAALSAAGHPMGVCTNKPNDLSRLLLDALDMSRFFSAVVGGDGVPERKPHPGHLLATLKSMGVENRKVLMVGDSPNDVAAARAAGVPVVVVGFGYTQVPAETLGADLVISDFADLPRAAAEFL
ncbi:phosphoglycolate phosphatase [Telmatospirillum siberiense]|uniref:Phosphoglycolate phosphatase n=1 Tax=Telmatospirillum siberiense TaxID=382514 RepID=A0A2N3PWM5_9PROT|nr:phosphoglycolate phosphatase [Telmatospirillum siberiense]PKU24822.1 phosphoglycolate phosphatase [Telmatospirillum siberiense]